MQSAEIELKFPIHDLARLQSRLPGLGFLLDTPRTFEQNTLYDTPARTLRESKQILRIRRYGTLWTVTHKRQSGASPNVTDPARYKVRIETETQLDDGPALGAIFETAWLRARLPLRKVSHRVVADHPVHRRPALHRRGPSRRSCRSPPRCHLVLDETPIGDYAELEGPPAWIDDTLAKLGVDPATCLTDSYGRLFLAWKERTGSPAENLTFDEIPAPALLQPALH